MGDTTVPAPDTVPATGDPGDDTASRYRYQWKYAAIVCCMLLDEIQDVAEVFCEHHEDVLIKHVDGTFSGLQIKTRASTQEVWKTSDDAVKPSSQAGFVRSASSRTIPCTPLEMERTSVTSFRRSGR
jgi:hypothetical protein